MVVRVDVEPDILAWAIDRAGWDEETANKREPRLAGWINREKRPTVKQLEKFAHATHTPFGLFFLKKPPVEKIPIPDMRTIDNKRIVNPSGNLLDVIYMCQSRQDWYRDYAIVNNIEPFEIVGSATINTQIKQAANEIRQKLAFEVNDRYNFSTWTEALRCLIDYIENIGVLVMVSGIVGSDTHRRLDPEEFRGFALADSLAPVIFINGADTKAAQIFTLIHELAHIWLGCSALSEDAMDEKENKQEQWCNSVAAEVLLPEENLRVDYRKTAEVDELERLAQKYKISTLVVLKKIYNTGFLDWNNYVKLYRNEYERIKELSSKRRTDTSGGNFYYTQPLRLSRQFVKAVIFSTFEGNTTYRDAYRLLGIKKHSTFEKLTEILQEN